MCNYVETFLETNIPNCTSEYVGKGFENTNQTYKTFYIRESDEKTQLLYSANEFSHQMLHWTSKSEYWEKQPSFRLKVRLKS